MYACHEENVSASLTVPVSNVLRIHVLYSSNVTKRKPHLPDAIVVIDLDKNRLVEITPSSEPPDDGLTKIQ